MNHLKYLLRLQELSEIEVKTTVAYMSEIYDLCKGDERPFEEQSADPIASQEYQFEFPSGQIALGESFNVCVKGPGGYSDCKTLINSQ